MSHLYVHWLCLCCLKRNATAAAAQLVLNFGWNRDQNWVCLHCCIPPCPAPPTHSRYASPVLFPSLQAAAGGKRRTRKQKPSYSIPMLLFWVENQLCCLKHAPQFSKAIFWEKHPCGMWVNMVDFDFLHTFCTHPETAFSILKWRQWCYCPKQMPQIAWPVVYHINKIMMVQNNCIKERQGPQFFSQPLGCKANVISLDLLEWLQIYSLAQYFLWIGGKKPENSPSLR